MPTEETLIRLPRAMALAANPYVDAELITIMIVDEHITYITCRCCYKKPSFYTEPSARHLLRIRHPTKLRSGLPLSYVVNPCKIQNAVIVVSQHCSLFYCTCCFGSECRVAFIRISVYRIAKKVCRKIKHFLKKYFWPWIQSEIFELSRTKWRTPPIPH